MKLKESIDALAVFDHQLSQAKTMTSHYAHQYAESNKPEDQASFKIQRHALEILEGLRPRLTHALYALEGKIESLQARKVESKEVGTA